MKIGRARGDASSNTAKIASNSMWYGAEIIANIVLTFGTSIALARTYGPHALGYFNYIQWIANTGGIIGSLGIPTATRKYMAEFLGQGETGIAAAIFRRTFLLQSLLALALTTIGVGAAYLLVDSNHRLVSIIQIVSTLPSMCVFVPNSANMAREDMRTNAVMSIIGNIVYAGGVFASIVFGWGLLGVAIGILLSRILELGLKSVPVVSWARSLPRIPLPAQVASRFRTFAVDSTALMLIDVVVWDRSDIVFLKLLSADVSQITFYSVAFNLVEKATILPNVFSGAVGVTVLAQHGRGGEGLSNMISVSIKYLCLIGIPVLFGLAVLSPALVPFLYGVEYRPAVAVLTVAALLAPLKPLMVPAYVLSQVLERQRRLAVWILICGAINVTLDLLLIPGLGAFGAAIANGVAQEVAVIGIWAWLIRTADLHLDFRSLRAVALSGALMAAVLVPLPYLMPPASATVLGLLIAPAVYAVLIRLTGALQEVDRERLIKVTAAAPERLRGIGVEVVNFLITARVTR